MRVAFVVLAAAALSAPASAQAHLRLSAGAAFAGDIEQDLAWSPFLVGVNTPPRAQTISSDAGYDLGAALGWRFNERLSADIEYRRISNGVDEVSFQGGFSPTTGPNPYPPVRPDDDLEADVLMANARYALPNWGALTPMLSAGLGAAKLSSLSGQTDTGAAAQIGAGLSWRIGDTRTLGAELTHLRTEELSFGPKTFIPTGPFGPRATGSYAVTSLRITLEQAF